MKDHAYSIWGSVETALDGREWWCRAPIRSRNHLVSLPQHVGEFDRVEQPGYCESGSRRAEVGGERGFRRHGMDPHRGHFEAGGRMVGGRNRLPGEFSKTLMTNFLGILGADPVLRARMMNVLVVFVVDAMKVVARNVISRILIIQVMILITTLGKVVKERVASVAISSWTRRRSILVGMAEAILVVALGGTTSMSSQMTQTIAKTIQSA